MNCTDLHWLTVMMMRFLEAVGRGLALLAEIENNSDEANHRGYVARLEPPQNHGGRPKFNISKDQIQHLLQLHFSCPKIASLLGVSLRTVRQRMTDYGLSVSAFYADISDTELDRLVNDIRAVFPNCEYRTMDGHLRWHGVRVSQARVRMSMHRVDPGGFALR